MDKEFKSGRKAIRQDRYNTLATSSAVTQRVKRCTTLSGSHGEWTLSDDVRSGRRERQFPNAFRASLRDPFSKAALDCRIPDEYAVSTATFHIVNSATLTSTASGKGSYMFLPSPCLSFGAIDGTSTYNGFTFSGETKLGYATAPSSVLSLLDDFRVVSWGLRIRNLQPPGTAVGMVEVAQVPCGSHAPAWKMLNTSSFDSSQTLVNVLLNSVTLNGTVFSSLLNLPDSDEYAVQELMANDLLLVGKICAPSYLELKSANTVSKYNATYSQAFDGETYVTATGLLPSDNGMGTDPTQLDGRTAILLNLRGFPASTSSLDVEIIYHIEGTPAPLAQPGLTTGGGSRAVADPVGTARAVAALSREPPAKLIPPQIVHHSGGGVANPVDVRLGMGAASRVARGAGRMLAGPAKQIGAALTKRAVDAIVNKIVGKVNGSGKRNRPMIAAAPVTERAMVVYKKR